MTQEALKMALECAERCEEIDGMYSWIATITAIKEALAQTQEPVDDDIASIIACRDMLDAQPVQEKNT